MDSFSVYARFGLFSCTTVSPYSPIISLQISHPFTPPSIVSAAQVDRGALLGHGYSAEDDMSVVIQRNVDYKAEMSLLDRTVEAKDPNQTIKR